MEDDTTSENDNSSNKERTIELTEIDAHNFQLAKTSEEVEL